VNGEYGVVSQAERVAKRLHTESLVYSGSAPRHRDEAAWDEEKIRTARRFKRNQAAVLVATKAFGMGIDKPNIRYSVHLGLPQSIEAFYQEAGRAGRDRNRAECGLIVSVDDPRRAETLLDPATPLEDVAKIVADTSWGESDDIIRALFFHVRSFKGVRTKLEDVSSLLTRLEPCARRHNIGVTWGSRADSKQGTEKALHRLVVLGVVEDYSVDWGRHEFRVQVAGAEPPEIVENLAAYGSSYQVRRGRVLRERARDFLDAPYKEFVLSVSKLLLHFIYETVELGRRRACREMLQAARHALRSENDGEALRHRLLDYLQKTEWDERVEIAAQAEDGGLEEVPLVVDDVITERDAEELRAAAGRLLESYPDVPSLLFFRGYAEALSSSPDRSAVVQDIRAGAKYAVEQYAVDPLDLAEAIRALAETAARVPWLPEVIIRSTVETSILPRTSLRSMCEGLPEELAAFVAGELIHTDALEASEMLNAHRRIR